MTNGSTKRIDEVDFGDLVIATNPATGRTEPQRVSDLVVGTGGKELVDIEIVDAGGQRPELITATDGHPFWVTSRGWVDAGELAIGDLVIGVDGTESRVAGVRESYRLATVHNLTITRLHTYYVVANNLTALVHNGSCPVHGHAPSGGGKSSKERHDKGAARKQRDQKKSKNPNTRTPVCT